MHKLISNINNQIEIRQSLISLKAMLTDDISLLDTCDKSALIALITECLNNPDAKTRKSMRNYLILMRCMNIFKWHTRQNVLIIFL